MLKSTSLVRIALVMLSLCMLPGAYAAAQNTTAFGAGQVYVARETLEELLAQHERTANSTAYSSEVREQARREAALIRLRLEQGDLLVGDQVSLYVEGETALTDTFTVGRGRILTLPVVGDVPLTGVLHAELEPYLTEQIARKIKDPVVEATSLIRLSIEGSVGQQGFYVAPSNLLLTDVLMMAGGPANDAKLTAVYITRDGERIWEGEALQDAIVEGRTLDQLGLQAGDRIVVPGQNDMSTVLRTMRNVGIVAGAVWAIVRIYRFAN